MYTHDGLRVGPQPNPALPRRMKAQQAGAGISPTHTDVIQTDALENQPPSAVGAAVSPSRRRWFNSGSTGLVTNQSSLCKSCDEFKHSKSCVARARRLQIHTGTGLMLVAVVRLAARQS